MAEYSSEDIDKYLYQDRQSDLLSRIGALVTHACEKVVHYGKVEFVGLDKLKSAEPSVIAPTHQSSSDIPVMGWAAMKAGLKPPSFIAKAGLVEERRFTGRILPFTGAFYIEQSRRDQPYLEEHIRNKIASGRSVVMFPEGTRRPEGQEFKLQKGLGILAVRLELDVTPVGIYGPDKSVLGRKSPVGVVVGDTIKAGSNPAKFRNYMTEVLVDLHKQAEALAVSSHSEGVPDFSRIR